MTIRTILVCLTTADSSPELLQAAATLARRENAHVIGMHTLEALVVYPGIAMHIPDATFETFSASQKLNAKKIEELFRAKMDKEDFASEWRLLNADSTTASERMIESARAADLVIMGQKDDEHDRIDQRNVQANVIRNCGRPVLIIPKDFDTKTLGEKVLLGWSATREATRAAHDLLQFVGKASNVRILRVGEHPVNEMADYTANDLATTYAHHGLKANVVHRGKSGHSIAEVLMKEAFEMGADMIVTGAFGHSRTYDFVIGAVTQGLLENAKLPVLFSK